ncbi:acetyl-CoA hydrolase/transferase family protein [Pseudonocardia sp. P1]|nr:4-hydroxybutyrate coenzyme A transferase [Pseudonocardia sp. Ae707_Ps1]
MLDLRPFLARGAGVWWSQAAAEATPLVDALLDAADHVGPIRAFCGLSFNRRLANPPDSVALTSYGAMGSLRAAHRAGRLDVVPAHYSALPRLFAEGLLPVDVGLVQVAPPDADGRCSLGIGVDYAGDAVHASRTLIAEINHRMPVTRGTPGLPLERLAATVETDRPLPEAPHAEADGIDEMIAGRVAALVDDGDTIQMGVGALPDAIMDGLAGHRDLGFHGGMISDGVLRLVEKGVLTGARKEIDAGYLVTGTAIGSSQLYERLPDMPMLCRPPSYTHDPRVLASLRRLVAVNAAIEVDISGQVGSESTRGRYLGGIGGQADFSGAAARSGALSIIALRSTVRGASTIVPALHGPVSTARADVDVVVTEHGVAWLRGCPSTERPARLIAVAAPEHREMLRNAAEEAR